MLEWYSDLSIFPKIYWTIAIVASLIFLIVIVSTFLGGDSDGFDSVDTEVETDADTGIGFQFITFKNLIGFFTIFGWSGIACLDGGLSKPITILVSFVCGLIMMTIMAAMFYYMRKLNHSGTLNYKNALNQIGEVYLTVQENRSKMGKVSIRIQGSYRELDALTDSSTPLKTGTVIKVIDITANGILIIEQLNN
jgi:hypothetical protein